MQQGSIWGHGSYVAPDWSADWLHREALALLDLRRAQRTGASMLRRSGAPDQARLGSLLQQAMRTNTYDPQIGRRHRHRRSSIARSRRRLRTTRDLFEGRSPDAHALREHYAIPIDASLTTEEAAALNAFFFWTAWAATTERPGTRSPTPATGRTSLWSATRRPAPSSCGRSSRSSCCSRGIGALVWYYAREFDVWRRDGEPETGFARQDFMNVRR